MSAYADRVQEELAYFQETYDESDGWKAGAFLLDEAEYGWISDARELLNRYFMDAYGLDVSQRTAEIEVYASENLPEVVDGFSDGALPLFIDAVFNLLGLIDLLHREFLFFHNILLMLSQHRRLCAREDDVHC